MYLKSGNTLGNAFVFILFCFQSFDFSRDCLSKSTIHFNNPYRTIFQRGANLYIVSIIHPLFSINIDYLNGARPDAFEYCHTVTIITPIGYRNLLDKVELFIYMLVACAKPELHSRFFFKSGSRAG